MKLEMMDRLGKSGLSIGQFIVENSGTITYNDYRGHEEEKKPVTTDAAGKDSIMESSPLALSESCGFFR